MLKRILLTVVLAYSHLAVAYKVEPMTADIEPVGKRSQMTMRIHNTSPTPLTVELHPYSMNMDTAGNETTTPAEDEILIIPMTTIVPPGRSQAVMVRYLGDPVIKQSKTYRINVKQVSLPDAFSAKPRVELLIHFNTLLNVVPKDAKPELHVNRVIAKDDSWQLEVSNIGNKYGRVSKTEWRISDGTQSLTLNGFDAKDLVEGSLVLPNSTRTFVMKPIESFDAENIKIAFNNN
ncbi:molecular chaperone [Alteromonas ponticola]|uniref:Molecular chaperone n=1 Tax=Alteromonas ponticola TaxID=2720613 RepID=A0ABX1R1Y8_9ALTE|nr:molecular chaperone [Alteromonas ponticola]NMH60469.1 molecular chaperone [Alteromonas ponticola]